MLRTLFLRIFPRPDLLFYVEKKEEIQIVLCAICQFRRVYGCKRVYLLADRALCDDPEVFSAAMAAEVILLGREEN